MDLSKIKPRTVIVLIVIVFGAVFFVLSDLFETIDNLETELEKTEDQNQQNEEDLLQIRFQLELQNITLDELQNIIDLSNHTDLSGSNLSGANLSGAILVGANLSHSNLSYANLSGADFTAANLTGAILSHAVLSHTIFDKAIIDDVNMTNAKINGMSVRNATIRNSNLNHVFQSTHDNDVFNRWEVLGLGMSDEHCYKSNSNSSSFTDTIIENTSISFSEITGIDFSNAFFSEVEMRSSTFNLITMNDVKVVNSEFSFLRLNCLEMTSSIIDKLDSSVISIQMSNLSNSEFSNSDLHSFELSFTDISWSKWQNIEFETAIDRIYPSERTIFSYSIMDYSTFINCSFDEAEFLSSFEWGGGVSSSGVDQGELLVPPYERFVDSIPHVSSWIGAKFVDVEMNNSNFIGSILGRGRLGNSLTDASFVNSSFKNTDFIDIDGSFSEFLGVEFSNVFVNDSVFSDSIFSEVSLNDVSFINSNFSNAHIEILTESTTHWSNSICPDGEMSTIASKCE